MCEMDLSVGGAFRFAMAGPQRRADGKTTLTMNTLFDSQSMEDDHVGQRYVQGTDSGYDQFADVLAALTRAGG